MDVAKAAAYADSYLVDRGVIASRSHLIAILLKTPAWMDDYFDNGPDTTTHEWLMNLVAQELVGRDWPLAGEPEREQAAFAAAFRSAAHARGWLAALEDFPALPIEPQLRERPSSLAERL